VIWRTGSTVVSLSQAACDVMHHFKKVLVCRTRYATPYTNRQYISLFSARRTMSTRPFPVHCVTLTIHWRFCLPCLFVPGMNPNIMSFSRNALIHGRSISVFVTSPGQSKLYPVRPFAEPRRLSHALCMRCACTFGTVTLHLKRPNVTLQLFVQRPCLWAVCDYRPNQWFYESSCETITDRSWFPNRHVKKVVKRETL